MGKGVLNAIIVHKTDLFFSYDIYKYKQNTIIFVVVVALCLPPTNSFISVLIHASAICTLMVILYCYNITSTDNNDSCIDMVSLSCHHLGGIYIDEF